jgi:hypothetical protein
MKAVGHTDDEAYASIRLSSLGLEIDYTKKKVITSVHELLWLVSVAT